MSARTCLKLTAGICEGVRGMHGHGVAHFDVKPANVLISNEGGCETAKLCDLGCARAIDPATGLANTGGQLMCAPSTLHLECLSTCLRLDIGLL